MDLTKMMYQCKTNNRSDEELQKEMSKRIHKELKQMSEKEFLSCLSSASFNTETYETEILLKILKVGNKTTTL